MKKLTVVVTHYKEPVDTYKALFDSLAIQQGIDLNDIEVIVVQDGNEGGVPLSFLEQYTYTTRLINIPKGGVSKARNKGLDEATGEYVMFCDCDDMFYSAFGLWMLMRAIEQKPDVIFSSFTEESMITDEYHLIRKDKDITFIHGKAFRKEWLVAENIRFKDELTIHEDGYFVALCNVLSKTQQYIDQPFYLWRWNPNSVVRRDRDNFLLKTYVNLVDSRDALMEQFRDRGYEQDYTLGVCKCFIDMYYDFNTSIFIGADVELKKKAMLRIRRFWTKYKDVFYKNDANAVQSVSIVSRGNAVKKGMSLEMVTIREFITIVENFKI